MSIPDADIDLLEGPAHVFDALLNVWPLRAVASAQVNQSTFTAPVVQLTVDNTSDGWGDIKVGQMVRVTNGSTQRTVGVVRKAPTSTVLYIDAKSLGDPGQAALMASAITDNDTVTIYDLMPLWAIYSVIRSKKFYKAYDLAFSASFATHPAPVANIGPWRQADANPTTLTQTLTFSAADSFDWNAEALTFAWTLPASGATLLPGYSLSDMTIEVEFTTGFHLMQCDVSNGTNSRMAIRPVWINHPDHFPPISESQNIAIRNDRNPARGRRMSIAATTNTLISDIPDFGAFLLSEKPRFNGHELSEDAGFVDSYVGLVSEWERSGTATMNTLAIDLDSPADVLDSIGCVSQALAEKASPTKWNHIKSGLGHPSFVIWYLIHYHCPNALTLFDYYPLSDTTRKLDWTTQAGTLAALVSEVAETVGASFGAASDGAFYLLRNPLIEGSSYRGAMDERMTITEDHITDEIVVREVLRPKVGQLTLYSFALNAAETKVKPLKSVAGYSAQGQGSSRTQGPALLMASGTNGQPENNQKAGDLLAQENMPVQEIALKMNRNFDIFDPARDRDKWWRLDIDAAYDPRGKGVSGRSVVTEVSREWRQSERGLTKHVEVTVKPEADGYDGEGVKIPTGQQNTTGYPPPTITVPTVIPPPIAVGLPATLDNLAVLGNNGHVYTTASFGTPEWAGGPTWSDYDLGIGTVVSAAYDPYSPTYRGTGSELNACVVTGTDIYMVSDVLGARTVTLAYSFGYSSSLRCVVYGRGNPGIILVSTNRASAGGTLVAYSINYGVSWTEVTVTSYYNSSTSGLLSGEIIAPPIYLSDKTPGLAYVGAYTVTGSQQAATSALFRSTNYGASWLEVSGMTNAQMTGGYFHFPYANNFNDTTFYWGKTPASGGIVLARTKAGVQTTMDPLAGSNTAGILSSGLDRPMSSPDVDGNRLVVCGARVSGSAYAVGLYVSYDGGTSWLERVAEVTSGRWLSVFCSRLYSNVIYLLGTGRVGYSSDFGVTIERRDANLSASGVRLLAIAGVS